MIQTFADKIQSPAIDIPGAFAGGLKVRAAMDEMRKAREADQALPALLDAYGKGDAGALARVAYYNPQLATGLAQAHHYEMQAKAEERKANYERFSQEGQFFSDSLRALNSVPPEQRGEVYEGLQDIAERAGVDLPAELSGQWSERKQARIGAMARMYAQNAAPFQGTSMEAQIANLAYGQALSQGADPDEAKMMAVNAAATRGRTVTDMFGDQRYIQDAPVFPGVGALGRMAGPAAQSPAVGYAPPQASQGALSRAPAANLPSAAGALSQGVDFSPELDAGMQDMFGAMPQPVELLGEVAGDALPPPDSGAYAALPPIDSALMRKPFAQKAIAEEAIKAPFAEDRAQRDEGRKIEEEKRALDREIDKERRALAADLNKESRAKAATTDSAKTELQKQAISQTNMLESFDAIEAFYDPRLLAYAPQIAGWGLNIKEKLTGKKLSGEEEKLVNDMAQFKAATGEAFNNYKVQVTGAAAGVQEMKNLEDIFVNADRDGPTKFESKFRSWKVKMLAGRKAAEAMLASGFSPDSPIYKRGLSEAESAGAIAGSSGNAKPIIKILLKSGYTEDQIDRILDSKLMSGVK